MRQANQASGPLIHQVLSADGEILSSFDFSKLDLHPETALALRRALAAEFGHTSLESQRQAWRCVRKLAAFLHEKSANHRATLPVDVAQGFHDWLEKSGAKGATNQSQQNVVLNVLGWCARNVPNVLSPRTSLVISGFVRDAPQTKPIIASESLKKILELCYRDIEETEKRLEVGRRVLAGDRRTKQEAWLGKLYDDLFAIGGGWLPTRRKASSTHHISIRVNEALGTRELLNNIALTPDAMFPYYLAILLQTGANPMSLLAIDRDCIHEHPLRDDLERITWEKKRGNKEDRTDFPIGRTWSAPSLIRRLKSLNESLSTSDRCRPKDRGKLFVCAPQSMGRFAVPCFQLMHLCRMDFIAKHKLEGFDFKSLRRSGADEHHHAGGTVLAATRRLNHRSARTTEHYTSISRRSSHHDQFILKFQGLLVREALGETLPKNLDNQPLKATPGSPTQTAFGFVCKDPFAGISPGSVAGSLCTHFHKCATCSGAIIPLDDVTVVARLLAAERHLNETKQRASIEGWNDRYMSIYEPSRRILVEDILPLVDSSVRAKSAALATYQAFPHLE